MSSKYAINKSDTIKEKTSVHIDYEPDLRRETRENLIFAHHIAKNKGEYYKGSSFFDMAPIAPQKPLQHMKSTFELTASQLIELNEMEHWHFISMQIWVLTIGNMVMALFQFAVFGLAIFANDFDTETTSTLVTDFAFECKVGHSARWWIAKTSQSEMMYELHPIILHMYITLAMIVLNTVPFKYDRLYKTREEKEVERRKKKKDCEKKAQRKL